MLSITELWEANIANCEKLSLTNGPRKIHSHIAYWFTNFIPPPAPQEVWPLNIRAGVIRRILKHLPIWHLMPFIVFLFGSHTLKSVLFQIRQPFLELIFGIISSCLLIFYRWSVICLWENGRNVAKGKIWRIWWQLKLRNAVPNQILLHTLRWMGWYGVIVQLTPTRNMQMWSFLSYSTLQRSQKRHSNISCLLSDRGGTSSRWKIPLLLKENGQQCLHISSVHSFFSQFRRNWIFPLRKLRHCFGVAAKESRYVKIL